PTSRASPLPPRSPYATLFRSQAYGVLEERLTPRLPLAERYAERRFPDPIGLLDDVLMTTRDLAIQLGLRLEGEGLGAQAFHLFLDRKSTRLNSSHVKSSYAVF